MMELIALAEGGMGITELAEQIGVDKSTASRLMGTLATYGFAEQDATTRRYRLGPKVVTLSRYLLTRMPLREQAKPFLHRLVDRTGEGAHLAILAQGGALYIDQVESPATLRATTGVGTIAPLHCTALGKALMTFGNLPQPQQMKAFTARTIVDADTLRVHLEQTRRQGYAVDDEEYEYGVRCVAVPVYDYRGKVVGAIGVSGPAGRMSLERVPEIARIVMEVGKDLSDRLSFR